MTVYCKTRRKVVEDKISTIKVCCLKLMNGVEDLIDCDHAFINIFIHLKMLACYNANGLMHSVENILAHRPKITTSLKPW